MLLTSDTSCISYCSLFDNFLSKFLSITNSFTKDNDGYFECQKICISVMLVSVCVEGFNLNDKLTHKIREIRIFSLTLIWYCNNEKSKSADRKWQVFTIWRVLNFLMRWLSFFFSFLFSLCLIIFIFILILFILFFLCVNINVHYIPFC